MEILRAFIIAKREWENIKISLERCGDIGEFDSDHPVNSRLTQLEGSRLVTNLVKMEDRFPSQRYFTPEAAYVFSTLASSAGERLGLVGKLAQTFGKGYSWVRTGWFDLDGVENQHVIKQMIFFNLFYPFPEEPTWEFDSPEVKKKLKTVFENFVKWQDKPSSYALDVKRYRSQLENLFGVACH
jgi:hypothetical protein